MLMTLVNIIAVKVASDIFEKALGNILGEEVEKSTKNVTKKTTKNIKRRKTNNGNSKIVGLPSSSSNNR